MTPRPAHRRKPAAGRPSVDPVTVLLLAFIGVGALALRWREGHCGKERASSGADNPRRHLADLAALSAAQEGANRGGAAGGGASAAAAAAGGRRSVESWAAQEPWHPPRYSTHTCIGQKFDDHWQMATCKFDNICLNASTLEFEYYLDPQYTGDPVTFDQAGRPYWDFPEHLLHPGHFIDNKTMSWRPVVKRQPFPAGPRVVWAPAAQALLQAFPVRFVYNFGHAMYDVAVPMFNMQYLLGSYTPDAQPLILWASGDTEERLEYRMHAQFNSWHPELSLLRLTWDHDAWFLKQYAQSVLGDEGDGLVCFKSALAGTGYLSRRLSRVDALPYRQTAIRRLGLRDAPHEVPAITILSKQGRRMIENTEEIAELLRARFPTARLSVVDFMTGRGSRPNMTIPEQVKLMSETSILISPCGGLATVLAFLQPGSTAIVMNYWHTLKNRSVNMEERYYRNLEYLDIQYFPVTPEEYQGTRDRPGCELVEGSEGWRDGYNLGRFDKTGALANCNLLIRGSGLERLLAYVDQAMLRWAARTGRYEAVASIHRQGGGQQGCAEGGQC